MQDAMSKTPQKAKGRPRKPEEQKYVLLHLRVPKTYVSGIGTFKNTRSDLADRSAAVRFLLRNALLAEGINVD